MLPNTLILRSRMVVLLTRPDSSQRGYMRDSIRLAPRRKKKRTEWIRLLKGQFSCAIVRFSADEKSRAKPTECFEGAVVIDQGWRKEWKRKRRRLNRRPGPRAGTGLRFYPK